MCTIEKRRKAFERKCIFAWQNKRLANEGRCKTSCYVDRHKNSGVTKPGANLYTLREIIASLNKVKSTTHRTTIAVCSAMRDFERG